MDKVSRNDVYIVYMQLNSFTVNGHFQLIFRDSDPNGLEIRAEEESFPIHMQEAYKLDFELTYLPAHHAAHIPKERKKKRSGPNRIRSRGVEPCLAFAYQMTP